MFGGLGRCFEEDPFFRDPFAAHHEYMRQMMRSFSDPFGRDPFLSITDGGERTVDRRARQDSQVALRGNRRLEDKRDDKGLWNSASFGGGCSNLDRASLINIAETQTVTYKSKGEGVLWPEKNDVFSEKWVISEALCHVLNNFSTKTATDADFGEPFFAMDRMMSNMRNSMLEMQRKFDDLSIHPDAHTFSSSSVMTYSKIGDEPPKVFRASAQTRTAPGGVKETRKALKDSESGLEKMAIGHHIHDRAHVIKKSKNSKTGDEEMNQEFINLDETEAQTFDEEWQKEIMKFKPSRTKYTLEAPKYRSTHHIPREGGLRREKPLAVAGSREPRVSLENLNVKGTHVPSKAAKNKLLPFSV